MPSEKHVAWRIRRAMTSKTIRIWLAWTGILIALIAATLVVFLLRDANRLDDTERFARATGFILPTDNRVLRPVIPHRSFPTKESLVLWQNSMRTRLLELFKRPGSPFAAPRVLERATLPAPPGLVRERLQFAGAHGVNVPAILQYPVGAGVRPAILLIPGHVPSGDSGLRQLVTGDDSEQRSAATALAQRGFVTLAFELRGFGLLGLRQGAEHNSFAFNALRRGSFYKAIVIDDAFRALALLRSMPQVDSRRVGVSGVSIGGELAVTLAALDPTIAAIGVSAYGGTAGPFDGVGVPDTVPIHYCHIIPGDWTFLRQEDMQLLLAPRAYLMVRGAQEYEKDNLFVTTAAAAWDLLGARDQFQMRIMAKKGHEFFVDETAKFFANILALDK